MCQFYQRFYDDTCLLQTCLSQMNATFLDEYSNTCVYDLCAVPEDKVKQLCNIAQQVAKECQTNFQVDLKEWRVGELDICGKHYNNFAYTNLKPCQCPWPILL